MPNKECMMVNCPKREVAKKEGNMLGIEGSNKGKS
jgi:hypothetical protein